MLLRNMKVLYFFRSLLGLHHQAGLRSADATRNKSYRLLISLNFIIVHVLYIFSCLLFFFDTLSTQILVLKFVILLKNHFSHRLCHWISLSIDLNFISARGLAIEFSHGAIFLIYLVFQLWIFPMNVIEVGGLRIAKTTLIFVCI